IQLFFQSSGILPSQMILLNRIVNQLTLSSPPAISISATTPDGPAAFPGFIFFIAALTSSGVMHLLGPQIASALVRLFLSQANSSFRSLSKYSFQARSIHYPRSISDDSTISIFNTATLSHILVLPY